MHNAPFVYEHLSFAAAEFKEIIEVLLLLISGIVFLLQNTTNSH